MRLHYRYLIYIFIFWLIFQCYQKVKWYKRRLKYSAIKFKQLKKNFPDLNKKNHIEDDIENIKTILLATSVYGMDHWGIGLGTEPFKIQGALQIFIVQL